MSVKITHLPKVTAKLITEAFPKNAPMPLWGMVVGCVANMDSDNRGQVGGTYQVMQGTFAVRVPVFGEDGLIKEGEWNEYRASKAIFPPVLESHVQLAFSDDAKRVDFAVKLALVAHPTKRNLTMWTIESLVETNEVDPLQKLLEMASTPKRAQLAAQEEKRATKKTA